MQRRRLGGERCSWLVEGDEGRGGGGEGVLDGFGAGGAGGGPGEFGGADADFRFWILDLLEASVRILDLRFEI